MMKKKGYKMGGKVKMKKGGKVKKKGYAMGGKVSPRKMMAKGMKMGGKVKTKGMKRGGKVNNLKKAIKKVKAKTKKEVMPYLQSNIPHFKCWVRRGVHL